MSDAIEETAYVSLMINCDNCGDSLDTFQEDPPVDPMTEWAKRFARRARELGWNTDAAGRILCQNCQRQLG